MNKWSPRSEQFFFHTRIQPCPYIAGRLERKIVTDLSVQQAPEFYEKLSLFGFRRSHGLAYRPDCPGCCACVPVRVVAADFKPSRSFQRVTKRNRDLTAQETDAQATGEQYRLFTLYQQIRHKSGEMSTMSYSQYRLMIEDTPVATRLVEFRFRNGDLAAVMLMDRMEDALSAVYSFFDPAADSRSLGSYMILWMLGEARSLGMQYVYLGYWIEGSKKMSYKARFRPLEALDGQGWRIMPE